MVLRTHPQTNITRKSGRVVFAGAIQPAQCWKKNLLLPFNRSVLTCAPVDRQKERMSPSKTEVLQGTLDLLVLKTLDAMGPMHGFGIALRIQQISEDLLQLNQGTLYPALLRLEQRGWIASKWGISQNNRKAKYYSLTRSGRKQLEREAEDWTRMSAMINRVLSTS
jgi:PadR family transcriptional regulator, regulatory protein PadR